MTTGNQRGLMNAELLSIVSVDVERAVEAEFNKWYNDIHIPEVLACPGWLWGSRYVSTEGENSNVVARTARRDRARAARRMAGYLDCVCIGLLIL